MLIKDSYNEKNRQKEINQRLNEINKSREYQLTRSQKIKEISNELCNHIKELFMNSPKADSYFIHANSLLRRRRVNAPHIIIQHRLRLKKSDELKYSIGRESDWDDYEKELAYVFYVNESDANEILSQVCSFLQSNNILLCFDTRYGGKMEPATWPGEIDVFQEPTLNNLTNAVQRYGYSLFLPL